MKQALNFIILFITFILLSACYKYQASPFWELPDPYLPEIAMIRTDPNFKHVVIYNPDTCEKIGDACGFFRLHAFAHEQLRHTILGEPDDYPISQENAADCWAAKYGKPNDVYAAVELMLDSNRDPNLRIHGNPEERAALIERCAKETGNWIG
ncbi:MAG: hypothetical protein MI865_09265 [Proteobacteria bacterium]|nr:hypothetical protein [Pseudomonadota bacterium]